MKTISIITINLNARDALERTIQSAMQQTRRSDAEYVVVDGVSEDGSKEIIECYRSQIEVISIEKDEGIFDAMNKGISLANGAYTYFLNAGDVFATNDVLEAAIETINAQTEVPNIICGKVRLNDRGKFVAIADFPRYIPHQGAFVKTALLKKYKFDDSFRIYGDLDLWTRMEKGGDYSVLHIDAVIADFDLNGIGSNPAYLYTQYKDRQKYFLKHKIYSKWLISTPVFVLFQSCYTLLGKSRYLRFKANFTSFKSKVLRVLKPSRSA
mgnify:CR=1 FL=1